MIHGYAPQSAYGTLIEIVARFHFPPMERAEIVEGLIENAEDLIVVLTELLPENRQ